MADVDAQKALAAGYSQAEIDAENAKRRAASATPAPAAPAEPSFGSRALDAAKFVVQQPLDIYSGLKRSIASTGRGARQAAAAIAPGLVDPESARLAQEKVEAEEAKNPPSTTSDLWKTIGDVAPWMIGGAVGVPAAIAKGTAMVPRVAKAAGMVPKWLQTTVGGAAGGAAQAPFEPTSDEYDLGGKAATGAAWGAATGPLGYVAGKAYAPFRSVGSKAGQENAAVLNAAGLPNQLPSTQSDSPYIRMLTDALEQVPGLGGVVKKARRENRAWGTGKFTEPTGVKIDDITPSSLEALKDRADDALNFFKNGPDVPTHGIPPHLQELVEQLKSTPTVASKAGVVKKVDEVGQQLTPTVDISPPPKPNIYGTIENVAAETPQVRTGNLLENVAAESGATGYGGKAAAKLPPVAEPTVQNTTRTAKDMMDLRNEASDMAHSGGSYLEKKAGRDLQEIIEQAIKDTHGDKGAAFDLALKRYGATKDVRRAAGEAAEHLVEGHLPVSRMVEASKGHFGMFPDRDRLVKAMAGNMPDAPAGWNRSLLTGLLLGSVPAAGGVSKLAGGDFSTGAAIPVSLGAAMVAGLSRKPPTKAQIDAVRRAMMGAAIAGNPFE